MRPIHLDIESVCLTPVRSPDAQRRTPPRMSGAASAVSFHPAPGSLVGAIWRASGSAGDPPTELGDLRGDVAHLRGELGADRGHGADDDNGDERRDQAVLDSRGAGFVFQEARNEIGHGEYPLSGLSIRLREQVRIFGLPPSMCGLCRHRGKYFMYIFSHSGATNWRKHAYIVNSVLSVRLALTIY